MKSPPLLTDYENLFSRLIQLKTRQRLNKTSFDSNYQVLASAIFLHSGRQRPVQAAIHRQPLSGELFPGGVLTSNTTAWTSLSTSLLRNMESSSLRDDARIRSYAERYQDLLQQDFCTGSRDSQSQPPI